MRRNTLSLALLIGAMAATHAAAAPEFPDTWVNGKPLSAEGLKGKVVALFFYEES